MFAFLSGFGVHDDVSFGVFEPHAASGVAGLLPPVRVHGLDRAVRVLSPLELCGVNLSLTRVELDLLSPVPKKQRRGTEQTPLENSGRPVNDSQTNASSLEVKGVLTGFAVLSCRPRARSPLSRRDTGS